METVQIGIRFPKDMKAWLEEQSRLNRSSQNSEVVRAVRATMKAAGEQFGDQAPAAQVTKEETLNQKERHHERDDSATCA
ncbi:hypothetical protein [Celeribacter indicus]|uniref:hypothetical protein n=1 Tax=Celeribacter indicus TaxID=1208324 RepID=UPI000896BDA8|nr:hypothetical protein [Celeribacter indicus]SDW00054.1 hypothetical protein SAMN05443573_1015 [Celeribacter indicus]